MCPGWCHGPVGCVGVSCGCGMCPGGCPGRCPGGCPGWCHSPVGCVGVSCGCGMCPGGCPGSSGVSWEVSWGVCRGVLVPERVLCVSVSWGR